MSFELKRIGDGAPRHDTFSSSQSIVKKKIAIAIVVGAILTALAVALVGVGAWMRAHSALRTPMRLAAACMLTVGMFSVLPIVLTTMVMVYVINKMHVKDASAKETLQ